MASRHPLSEPNEDLPGATVYNDESLKMRSRIFYGVLTKYCDVNGKCTLQLKTLMEDMQCSKPTITRATLQLEAKGILKRQRGSREVFYQLLK
ncbi:MAG: helix-turn-helix domain-containing protein [Ignavibacteria bacterium]|nr:helix-turn-helix domain-containing protein [Ignavibacteria bacterium]